MPLVPLSEDNPEGRPRGLQRLADDEQPPDFSGENFDAAANAAFSRVYENVAGIPDLILRGAVGDTPTTGVGLARRGVHEIRKLLPGNDDLPAKPPRIIEGMPIRDRLPSGEEAVAGLNSLILGRDQEEELQRVRDVAEQNPIATLMGQLGGDAATLFGLRVPLKAGRTGGVLDAPIERGLKAFSTKTGARAGQTGVLRQVTDVLEDERFQHLMRGAGRTMETGAETALLEMLSGNDPAEAAGLAMAGQALSSGALTIGKGTVELPFRIFGSGQLSNFSKATIGLAMQGALITSMFQFLQANPDAAAETAYDKLTAGALLAMTLGLPGKRPKEDGLLKNFPALADAILTVPRTAMIDAARYMAEDPVVGDVVAAAVESPKAFGQSTVEEINQALREGKPEKVREIYDSRPKIRELLELPAALRDVPTQRRRHRGPAFDL